MLSPSAAKVYEPNFSEAEVHQPNIMVKNFLYQSYSRQ